MTSNLIYHYVYRITNTIENKHYYGKRSSKIEPKLDLGKKYFSSSGDKEFISDQKLNPQNYRYKIVQTFATSILAILRESKLHYKFNVGKNEKFYNNCIQNPNGFNAVGRVLVKDVNGITKSVYLDDPRYISGEFVSTAKGKVITKDKCGNIHNVYLDDPRYISSELIAWSKNMVNLKDEAGNHFYTTKDDPRYIAGELVSIMKGTVIVKDKYGKQFKVSIEDGRYISGELVSVNVGKNTGKDHPKFVGYYVTPFGEFESKNALGGEFAGKFIAKCCKNPDIIVTYSMYKRNKFLNNNFTDAIVGNSFKSLGFGFNKLSVNQL